VIFSVHWQSWQACKFSVALNWRRWLPDQEYSLMCTIQGGVLQLFTLSSALWTVSISVNLMATFLFKKRYSIPFWAFHLVNWGLPALVAILLRAIGGHEMYSYRALWCAIAPKFASQRFFLVYLPIWLMFWFSVYVYIRSGIRIKKEREE
jgi:hypothetical protein